MAAGGKLTGCRRAALGGHCQVSRGAWVQAGLGQRVGGRHWSIDLLDDAVAPGSGAWKKRWIAAGMLEAERSFRRLKGHADMPALVAAITRATSPDAVTPINYAQVA
jgi:hypothetical protein